jgi:two-component sensor histidine kinase
VAITAREVGTGEEIEIEVRDDGAGLPDGFSVETSNSLGLSIIQRLVNEQLQGRFAIMPAPGGGTLARVTVPATQSGRD